METWKKFALVGGGLIGVTIIALIVKKKSATQQQAASNNPSMPENQHMNSMPPIGNNNSTFPMQSTTTTTKTVWVDGGALRSYSDQSQKIADLGIKGASQNQSRRWKQE